LVAGTVVAGTVVAGTVVAGTVVAGTVLAAPGPLPTSSGAVDMVDMAIALGAVVAVPVGAVPVGAVPVVAVGVVVVLAVGSVGEVQLPPPLVPAAAKAYSLPSSDPTYTTPPATAGDESM
jgi:hypothetical protein